MAQRALSDSAEHEAAVVVRLRQEVITRLKAVGAKNAATRVSRVTGRPESVLDAIARAVEGELVATPRHGHVTAAEIADVAETIKDRMGSECLDAYVRETTRMLFSGLSNTLHGFATSQAGFESKYGEVAYNTSQDILHTLEAHPQSLTRAEVERMASDARRVLEAETVGDVRDRRALEIIGRNAERDGVYA